MTRRTTLLLGASIVAMLGARCGGRLTPTEPQDASDESAIDSSMRDVAVSDDASFGADHAFFAPPDAGAYPPPAKTCVVDGGSKACPSPPSVCASSDWLVYYDHGRCVDGGCVWDTLWIDCPMRICTEGYCGQATAN